MGSRSIYRVLATHGAKLFPDDLFADLCSKRGRRSVPPRVMATVMVLQRFEGLSDVEATQRLEYDVWFKWACGLQLEDPSFDSTLLVDMRARLRASARPNRIFDAVLDVAKQAGLVGRKRIIDSTALYDAVSTQDTVTLVRIAVDADSEIITSTDVTAANASDAATAEAMLGDVLIRPANGESTRAEVYGDASYGSADLLEKFDCAGVEANVKVQPPVGRSGMFSQDDFALDRDNNEMRCPAGVRVSLTVLRDGSRSASFGAACATCPLRSKCTDSKTGER